MADDPASPGEPGRPPHVPTDKDRRAVEMMTAGGITQEGIAKVIGISVDTLVKYYREEIDTALDKANAQVAGSLFRKATSESHPGAVTAAIFWMKTRGRWKETNALEVGGVDGGPMRSETVYRWEE